MSLAFVFPGQGSQSLGMQSELAAVYPAIAEVYGEASDVLGFDVYDMVQNGPADQLNQTVNTQPVMLTAGVAAWRAWQAAGGGNPAMMAGHSLGEYSALVCAGSLELADALRVVRKRAELMQDAVPAGEGAMAAVLGLDDQVVVEVCSRADGVSEAVNFNSPGQVVIAGAKTAVEQTVELAKEAGARRAILLPVSVPAHSMLMRPAGDALAEPLAQVDFSTPAIPVVNASNAEPYGDPESIRTHLSQQVYSAVRWVDVINYIIAQGVTTIAECGPGKVLTGLVRRIDKSIAASCLVSPDAISDLLTGVGK